MRKLVILAGVKLDFRESQLAKHRNYAQNPRLTSVQLVGFAFK